MRAVTLRRLMVFGVCMLGVGALYLVPSMARAPEQIGSPRPAEDTPSQRPTSSAPRAPRPPAPQPTPTTTTTTFAEEPPPRAPATAPDPETDVDPTQLITTEPPRRAAPPTRPASTPFVPGPVQDESPPDQVSALEANAGADQLRLVWAPGTDDVGVIRYRIWLNGYEVKITDETAVTLDWFNDDSTQHVVQVRAVDAAGNESQEPATLLVTRPTPAPPTPEPNATSTPSTDASESPSPSPTSSPTDDGND